MPRALPHHLTVQHYTTRRGVSRTLYYIRFKDWRGIRRKFPAGDDLTIAKQLRDRLLGQNALGYDFDQDRRQGMTLGVWFERFLALKQHKRSHEKDRCSARTLLAFFGPSLFLRALSTTQIEAYKQTRLQQPHRYGRLPKPATINRELAFLRSALRLAAAEGLLEAMALPMITLLREQNERERLCTPAEYQRLCTAAPATIRPVLILLYELGLREGEVLGLRWEHIRFAERLLIIPRTKTDRSRIIPFNLAVERELETLYAQRSPQTPLTAPVFFNQRGQPLTRRRFHRWFATLCQRLNIEGLWAHDLRRTFITRNTVAGIDRELIKRLTGHTTDIAFGRYNKPTVEDLRRVVDPSVP
jgi:integrase